MMFDLAPFVGFAMISFMMAISPGPSWVYTVSTTLSQGRRAGMVGNFGNSTGILFHAVAATAGLSALLSYSANAFDIVKMVGAGYLFYLGFKAFTGTGLMSMDSQRVSRSFWQIYRNGALVNILNPKMLVLFIALLPQFVMASSANMELQIALLGITHAVIACIVHTHVVFFSGAMSSRIHSSQKAQRAIQWLTGTLFIGFGLRLAVANRS